MVCIFCCMKTNALYSCLSIAGMSILWIDAFCFLVWLFPFNNAAGPKDTPIELVLEKTFDEKAGIGMPDL